MRQHPIPNLVGEKFGCKQVISYEGKIKGERRWKTKCIKCDTIRINREDSLRYDSKDRCKSCLGLELRTNVNLENKWFGYYHVKKRGNYYPEGTLGKSHGWHWECLCSLCDRLFEVHEGRLTREGVKSCQECSPKIHCGPNNTHWQGFGEIPLTMWNRIKTQCAANRNLEFTITIEYAWDIFLRQNRICVLSGRILQFGNTNGKETTASLDRIDSSKGYITRNVQWLHKDINCAKWDWSDQEFIEVCREIVEYQNKKTEIINE